MHFLVKALPDLTRQGTMLLAFRRPATFRLTGPALLGLACTTGAPLKCLGADNPGSPIVGSINAVRGLARLSSSTTGSATTSSTKAGQAGNSGSAQTADSGAVTTAGVALCLVSAVTYAPDPDKAARGSRGEDAWFTSREWGWGWTGRVLWRAVCYRSFKRLIGTSTPWLCRVCGGRGGRRGRLVRLWC
jgi:hypothetical protein